MTSEAEHRFALDIKISFNRILDSLELSLEDRFAVEQVHQESLGDAHTNTIEARFLEERMIYEEEGRHWLERHVYTKQRALSRLQKDAVYANKIQSIYLLKVLPRIKKVKVQEFQQPLKKKYQLKKA